MGYEAAHMWRISSDVTDRATLLDAVRKYRGLENYSKPGGFNDLDMLIGSIRPPSVPWFMPPFLVIKIFSPVVSRTQFTVWSVLGAPLIIGAHLSTSEDNLVGRTSDEEVDRAFADESPKTEAETAAAEEKLQGMRQKKRLLLQNELPPALQWDVDTYSNEALLLVNQQKRQMGKVLEFEEPAGLHLVVGRGLTATSEEIDRVLPGLSSSTNKQPLLALAFANHRSWFFHRSWSSTVVCSKTCWQELLKSLTNEEKKAFSIGTRLRGVDVWKEQGKKGTTTEDSEYFSAVVGEPFSISVKGGGDNRALIFQVAPP